MGCPRRVRLFEIDGDSWFGLRHGRRPLLASSAPQTWCSGGAAIRLLRRRARRWLAL